jgi:hypothetical protein
VVFVVFSSPFQLFSVSGFQHFFYDFLSDFGFGGFY